MKSKDEIAKIFIEEAKKLIDEKTDELLILSNKVLNKQEDAVSEYTKMMEGVKDRLPNRGITVEEMKSFLPYVEEYQSEIAFYVMSKIFKPGGD